MLDCNRLIDPVVLSFARFEPRVSLGTKRRRGVKSCIAQTKARKMEDCLAG